MSTEPKKKTSEEIDLEMKLLLLEEAQLKVQTLKIDNETKKMNEASRLDVARGNGVILEDAARVNKGKSSICTHRKGGTDLNGLDGNGDSSEYAVWKVQWFDNTTWIRCLRCGKTWKPVRLEQFTNAVDFRGNKVYAAAAEAKEAFEEARREYREACAFSTKNQTGGTASVTVINKEKWNTIMDGIDLR